MNELYQQLEEGFVKKAVELGSDESFIRGYLKKAQDISDSWVEVYKKAFAQSNDPEYPTKIAHAIIMASPRIEKEADFMENLSNLGQGVGASHQGFDNLLGNVGGLFGKGGGVGGSILGGGGGALIGLLLAKALHLPPIVGLMLGGLGGAGLGGAYGNNMLKGIGMEAHPQTLDPESGLLTGGHDQQGAGTPQGLGQGTQEGMNAGDVQKAQQQANAQFEDKTQLASQGAGLSPQGASAANSIPPTASSPQPPAPPIAQSLQNNAPKLQFPGGQAPAPQPGKVVGPPGAAGAPQPHPLAGGQMNPTPPAAGGPAPLPPATPIKPPAGAIGGAIKSNNKSKLFPP